MTRAGNQCKENNTGEMWSYFNYDSTYQFPPVLNAKKKKIRDDCNLVIMPAGRKVISVIIIIIKDITNSVFPLSGYSNPLYNVIHPRFLSYIFFECKNESFCFL